jgi:hypothetical protein
MDQEPRLEGAAGRVCRANARFGDWRCAFPYPAVDRRMNTVRKILEAAGAFVAVYIVRTRSTLLLVALAFSVPALSAEVMSTNAGLFPSPAVLVLLTNGNQWAAEVTVTNTFTEAVDCYVYAVPITTNRSKLHLGPAVVTWSIVPPAEYGQQSWMYPPPMAIRYGFGSRVQIQPSQRASLVIGPGPFGLSPTNENALVVQYVWPAAKGESESTHTNRYWMLTARIGKRSLAEPAAAPTGGLAAPARDRLVPEDRHR